MYPTLFTFNEYNIIHLIKYRHTAQRGEVNGIIAIFYYI